MSKFIVILFVLVTVSCSSIVVLPIIENNNQSCSFSVIDNRPITGSILAHYERTSLFETQPKIQAVIRNSVCNNLNSEKKVNFYIEDFECFVSVSGFATQNYVIDLRGRLEFKTNIQYVREGNNLVISEGIVTTGCAASAKPVIDKITKTILKEIDAF